MAKWQIAIGGLVMLTSLGGGMVYADDSNRRSPVQGQELKEVVQTADTDKSNLSKAKGSMDASSADPKMDTASTALQNSGVKICPRTGKILRR